MTKRQRLTLDEAIDALRNWLGPWPVGAVDRLEIRHGAKDLVFLRGDQIWTRPPDSGAHDVLLGEVDGIFVELGIRRECCGDWAGVVRGACAAKRLSAAKLLALVPAVPTLGRVELISAAPADGVAGAAAGGSSVAQPVTVTLALTHRGWTHSTDEDSDDEKAERAPRATAVDALITAVGLLGINIGSEDDDTAQGRLPAPRHPLPLDGPHLHGDQVRDELLVELARLYTDGARLLGVENGVVEAVAAQALSAATYLACALQSPVHGDEVEDAATTCMDLLWPNGWPVEHNPAWWRTPVGRACAHGLTLADGDVGRPPIERRNRSELAQSMSQSSAAVVLDVKRPTIAQLLTRGHLERVGQFGVSLRSVLRRLEATSAR